jgi:RNase P subunit RPR2
MTCQRCNGLMVREEYDNLEFDSAGYEISGWRCLNCGAIVDSLIAAHHQSTHKTDPSRLWRQRLKELVVVA